MRRSAGDRIVPLIITFGIIGAFALGVNGALIGISAAIIVGLLWHKYVDMRESKWLRVSCPICGAVVAALDPLLTKKIELTCPDRRCGAKFSVDRSKKKEES